ncbi:MAG: hypothetical protein AB7O48_04010 [Cyclobacteriaceae bacterium]
MQKTSQVPPIIVKYLPIAEKIFLAGVGVGLVLIYLNFDSNVALISVNGIAIIYFLNAYKPPELMDDEPQGFGALLALSILPKVMWISSSVSLVGITFHFLELAGAMEMILIGAISLGVGLLLFLIFGVSGVKGMKVNVPMLYRLIPIFLVDLYLLYVSTNTM